MRNNYKGHRLVSAVLTVPANEISARDFFDSFVSQRRPVVLKSPNAEFLRTEFSNAKLANTIGDMVVEVEDKVQGPFGSTNVGRRKRMKFASEFLPAMNSGDFYLTTQKIKEVDGIPEDFAPLIVRRLIDSGLVPLSLPIAGNLVLDNVNIWMGASNDGSSSGCHHDFHDNLYFLIRGTKTFRLRSPDRLPVTTGKPKIVHKNGYISYVPGIRADGADMVDVLRCKGGEEELDEAEELELKRALSPLVDDSPPSFCATREAPEDAISVTLQAGDIFYLPAGYFHEVISYNDNYEVGHLAVNYWYHPPTEPSFSNPYPDNYWAFKAKRVARRLEKQERAAVKALSGKSERRHIKQRPLFRHYTQRQMKMFISRFLYVMF